MLLFAFCFLFFLVFHAVSFFSYKRTKSNNREGWQVLLRSLAYSCLSCGLFSYRITFSTSGLLRSWKWIILAVFKWVFMWFPETVLRGAPPPGVPRRSTIDPLGCDRERKRKKKDRMKGNRKEEFEKGRRNVNGMKIQTYQIVDELCIKFNLN